MEKIGTLQDETVAEKKVRTNPNNLVEDDVDQIKVYAVKTIEIVLLER